MPPNNMQSERSDTLHPFTFIGHQALPLVIKHYLLKAHLHRKILETQTNRKEQQAEHLIACHQKWEDQNGPVKPSSMSSGFRGRHNKQITGRFCWCSVCVCCSHVSLLLLFSFPAVGSEWSCADGGTNTQEDHCKRRGGGSTSWCGVTVLVQSHNVFLHPTSWVCNMSCPG